MSKSLITIIVPTYNRAHLISETLDSILAQTYQNWECIVVDDGSNDNTDNVVNGYIDKDSRFKYFKRTENYLSGGNGARNYGLDLAKGDFIVFFDSDDLMTDDHLQVKYDLINSGEYDFAVTRTKYFNYNNDKIDKYYNFNTQEITKENYILQKINWLTLDIIIKSSLAKKFGFNEFIKSGQEYNYFSKVVCLSDNGVFLNKVVSLRRHHEDSKRTTIAAGTRKIESIAISTWFTFLDIKDQIGSDTQKKLVDKVFNYIIAFKKRPKGIKRMKFWQTILKYYGYRAIIKFIYYHINKYTSRFIFIRRIALKT